VSGKGAETLIFCCSGVADTATISLVNAATSRAKLQLDRARHLLLLGDSVAQDRLVGAERLEHRQY